jgi:tetratricopeptide (TPR) repeat protein
MHDAALRGGHRDPPARPGCFLAGAGLVAALGLHTTPGLYPCLSLVSIGLAALFLPVLQCRRAAENAGTGPSFPSQDTLPAETLVLVAAMGPLIPGILASLHARPLGIALFWLATDLCVAGILWVWAADLCSRRQHEDALLSLSGKELETYARALAPVRQRVRNEMLLLAAERLAEEGALEAARSTLGLRTGDTGPGFQRRARRLESTLAFLEGNVEEARAHAAALLAGPLDLEEGRQYRAWAAYLELACGAPRFAAELAGAAMGPHAVAGEGWFEHCRSLQAWALWEQGYPDSAAALARFVLLNASVGSSYRAFLHALLADAYCRLGEEEPAGAHAREAMALLPGEQSIGESFLYGWACRRRAAEGRQEEALALARRAAATARGPFAGALAVVDQGRAWLLLGDARAAERDLRHALELWPWLPAAEEALAEAAVARGDAREGARLRSCAASRFPQHRVALPDAPVRPRG